MTEMQNSLRETSMPPSSKPPLRGIPPESSTILHYAEFSFGSFARGRFQLFKRHFIPTEGREGDQEEGET